MGKPLNGRANIVTLNDSKAFSFEDDAPVKIYEEAQTFSTFYDAILCSIHSFLFIAAKGKSLLHKNFEEIKFLFSRDLNLVEDRIKLIFL